MIFREEGLRAGGVVVKRIYLAIERVKGLYTELDTKGADDSKNQTRLSF